MNIIKNDIAVTVPWDRMPSRTMQVNNKGWANTYFFMAGYLLWWGLRNGFASRTTVVIAFEKSIKTEFYGRFNGGVWASFGYLFS